MTLTNTPPPPPAPAIDASALSCFTANLATYLEAFDPDPLRRIATTIRLAVRTGSPAAFAHHATDLGRLGPDRCLRYAATADGSTYLQNLDRALRADGQVLIVAYAGAMPWSLAEAPDPAPHFVRLAGRDGDRWEVDDRFSALLPAGVQRPFHDWVSTVDLMTAATPPAALPPEQVLRKEHAFGLPVSLPSGDYQWLEPVAGPSPTADVRPPGWIVDTVPVLEHLTTFYGDVAAYPGRARLVDDMWAAAQHHTFRYGHLLSHSPLSASEREDAEAAVKAWNDLPLALFYAANAAARGKPRPAVVPKAFGAVRDGEQRCADTLRRHGYAA